MYSRDSSMSFVFFLKIKTRRAEGLGRFARWRYSEEEERESQQDKSSSLNDNMLFWKERNWRLLHSKRGSCKRSKLGREEVMWEREEATIPEQRDNFK